ncbi:MAG TPA: hypothetical protein VK866_09935 [Acidimicrobiales bacterium]|nr:hypothetical protein [Acidimicrobiales bacterium]
MIPFVHTYDLHLDRSRTLLADAEARRLRTRPALGERLARRLAGRGRPTATRPTSIGGPVPAAPGGPGTASAPAARRELVGAAAGADVR